LHYMLGSGATTLNKHRKKNKNRNSNLMKFTLRLQNWKIKIFICAFKKLLYMCVYM
jgi:hypothetical protein